MCRFVAGLSTVVFALFLGCVSNPAGAQSSDTASAAPVDIDARPFPREFTVRDTKFEIHEPQYDSWKGNRLAGRFVMAVDTGTHTTSDGKSETSYAYGVVEFTARTSIDTGARAVVMSDITLGPASFPTATARQDEYLGLARDQLDTTSTLMVSLDQLESAIAFANVETTGSAKQTVNNDPPDIIFATEAAILVLIDGQAALRSSGVHDVDRVINSRSLLLRHHDRYYTYFAGQWAEAPSLDAAWTARAQVDRVLNEAMQKAVADKVVDTLDNPPEALKKQLADGKLPEIYVRTHPAELITVQGDPQFVAIPGTQLSYIDNSGADVFIDASADNAWYVLISGRWFSAASSKGPWAYVVPASLPGDFASIPPDSPKSGVLASIPGTPEAKESLIANSIPQTAAVDSTQAALTVTYDGAPQFAAIDGTKLQYAKNTPVPVIEVSKSNYYAVDKGIWFSATAPTGPWSVARSVPAEIYSIPTSSPLHYVTYVQIYGSSGDDVYVGYTPGYYGTVVSDDVVVYGSGYPCTPWIGAYWYGCPATYGMGVYFGWNPWVGWTFGLGWGWAAGWYGLWGPWWGPWSGAAYAWGWWGGGAAAWNVYGHWGNAAVRGTAASWANPWTGNYGRAARGGYYNEATGGRGVGRAAVNTNVYTGTTRAGAQGMRYNPQTGRAVAGGAHAAANPYTDRAAAGGQHTAVNTNTGRVTQAAGGVEAGREGAAGAGAFHSAGPGGDVSGAGGFHYNADTGTLDHSGVIKAGDNYYAGHDGNVYHSDGGQWQDANRGSSFDSGSDRNMQSLDNDRFARGNGDDRINGVNHGVSAFQGRPGGFDRGIGGFRGGLGARPMGGFGRMGGFRR